jgi:hypothetical protein
MPALFRVLVDPDLDSTNWRAEQALGPAVITDKVCGAGEDRSSDVLTTLRRTRNDRVSACSIQQPPGSTDAATN